MEIADSRIASAAERDRTCMTQHFPKTVRTLYRGCRAWTFYRFTDNDAASPTSNGNATKYVIPAMANLPVLAVGRRVFKFATRLF